MGKYPYRMTIASFAVLAALTIAACGGSTAGGNALSASAGQTALQAPSELSGVAAAGQPLTGEVYLSDASFPTKTASAIITQDGTFSFGAAGLAGLQAPFLLKAFDVSGQAWYSFAAGAGTTNLNPLTNLALAVASGSADPRGLSGLYDSHNGATLGMLSVAFPRAVSRIMATLQPLLAPFGAAGADPVAAYYAVNGRGLDGFLAEVDMDISGGLVTITDKNNATQVFSAQLNQLEAGTLNASALTPPATFYLPGNAILTLAVQGSLPSGTAIKSGSFTVQLPLGITVDTGPSGINTAIPIDPAAGITVYPAPVLSQTNNQVSVNFSSLAGFGTGDVLTLRCLVTSAALFETKASDFSVTVSSLYGDIYKSQRIKGIGIVPVGIVYPTHEGKAAYDSLCASCHTLSATVTTTASLYNKAGQLPAKFSSAHYGVTLTPTRLDYLSQYLTAVFSGQVVF